MGPDDKGVINEPFPTSRLERSCFKGFSLKMFHEDVCKNRREGRTHSSAFSLFIKFPLLTKEGRLKEIFDKVGEVLVEKTAGTHNSFFD